MTLPILIPLCDVCYADAVGEETYHLGDVLIRRPFCEQHRWLGRSPIAEFLKLSAALPPDLFKRPLY